MQSLPPPPGSGGSLVLTSSSSFHAIHQESALRSKDAVEVQATPSHVLTHVSSNEARHG
jgi:hypothetical protein